MSSDVKLAGVSTDGSSATPDGGYVQGKVDEKEFRGRKLIVGTWDDPPKPGPKERRDFDQGPEEYELLTDIDGVMHTLPR